MIAAPTKSITYGDVVEACAKVLAGVAPTVRGMDGLAQNTSPPRYAWVWQGVDPAPSKSFAPSSSKTLGDEVHRVLIEIWAKDEDQMLRMRRALITAVRQEIGYQRLTVAAGDLLEPSTDAKGIRVAFAIQVRIPATDTFLPPPSPAATPGSSPQIRDANYPLASVRNVSNATPATSTPGDGVVEFTEP